LIAIAIVAGLVKTFFMKTKVTEVTTDVAPYKIETPAAVDQVAVSDVAEVVAPSETPAPKTKARKDTAKKPAAKKAPAKKTAKKKPATE
jgi:topoisomerase IA-like protein